MHKIAPFIVTQTQGTALKLSVMKVFFDICPSRAAPNATTIFQ